ncbi:hypothetical protein FNV43_RR01466 [Rhamnella rubrinervis]|uniref:Uncharacterized protein n=1 Tax=Rhamnella rubrinervis TaxID=2594499 RepID=A0A8K0HPP4_9ROSA|nr:hypothetical protein FNV43_RR01466 [Rhamnella rubrinervis]
MQLCREVTRRLGMSGGNRGGGQSLGVHGIHMRLFSSRGVTPAGGLEAPNYKPLKHYNQDLHLNNPSHSYSSMDKNVKNTSEKRSPINVPYDFEKLKYHISIMDRDLKKLRRDLKELQDDLDDHCCKNHEFLPNCFT